MTRARDLADGKFANDLTVDTNTLKVDAANNRVGVGTASPTEPFHIVGTSGAATDMQIQGGDDTNSVRLFMGGDTNPLHGRIVYSTASDFMAFSTGGDQRVRVDSDGLKFGSDTAAANALDDYEEGAWTPAFGTGTTGSSTGRYTKIGRVVLLQFVISTTSDTTSSNNVQITGSPFSFVSDHQMNRGSFEAVNMTVDASTHYSLATQASGGNIINIRKMPSGGGNTNVDHSDFTATSVIIRGMLIGTI